MLQCKDHIRFRLATKGDLKRKLSTDGFEYIVYFGRGELTTSNVIIVLGRALHFFTSFA